MQINVPSYDYLTRHVVPGPYWPTFLPVLIILPVALLIPRQTLSRGQSIALFVPLITGLIAYSCYAMNGSDVIAIDTLLWAWFLLVFRDPWNDFSRLDASKLYTDQKIFSRREKISETSATASPGKSSSDTEEQTSVLKVGRRPRRPAQLRKRVSFRASEQSYPETFAPRLSWVGTLLVSIRLGNWKIGSFTHDRSQPCPPGFASRRAFVLKTLISFLRGYLILDLTRAYVEYDRYFTNPSIPIDSALPDFPFSQFVQPHLVRTAVTGAQAWALISEMFYLPCLLPVILNYYGFIRDEWSPHNWPPYFGPMSTILTHGVRGFWGQYWHQTMRWSVAGPGYAIADVLRIDQASRTLRYAIIATSAFFFSGVVHMGLVPPEPVHATLPVNQVRLLISGFFWSQIVAVLLETVVSKVAVTYTTVTFWRSGRPYQIRLAVNAFWTVVWFSTSLVLLSEAGRQLGYWRVWPVPISIYRGFRGKGYVAWSFQLA